MLPFLPHLIHLHNPLRLPVKLNSILSNENLLLLDKFFKSIAGKVFSYVKKLIRHAKPHENIINAPETSFTIKLNQDIVNTTVVYKEDMRNGSIFKIIAERKLTQQEKRKLPDNIKSELQYNQKYITTDEILKYQH